MTTQFFDRFDHTSTPHLSRTMSQATAHTATTVLPHSQPIHPDHSLLSTALRSRPCSSAATMSMIGVCTPASCAKSCTAVSRAAFSNLPWAAGAHVTKKPPDRTNTSVMTLSWVALLWCYCSRSACLEILQRRRLGRAISCEGTHELLHGDCQPDRRPHTGSHREHLICTHACISTKHQ
eukprot:COSAG01_NODE_4685_length_4814_cov_6.529374_3_plen_179_part_00